MHDYNSNAIRNLTHQEIAAFYQLTKINDASKCLRTELRDQKRKYDNKLRKLAKAYENISARRSEEELFNDPLMMDTELQELIDNPSLL